MLDGSSRSRLSRRRAVQTLIALAGALVGIGLLTAGLPVVCWVPVAGGDGANRLPLRGGWAVLEFPVLAGWAVPDGCASLGGGSPSVDCA